MGREGSVRNVGYEMWGFHLEAVMHGKKESQVEGVLLEPYKCTDISRYTANKLRHESTKLVDVELTSKLCEAKIISDVEWTRYQTYTPESNIYDKT